MTARSRLVVKVGGSLFDLPDLATRLQQWIDQQHAEQVLIVPGGGATADVVRQLDTIHYLGEDASHWLALRTLTINAHFLQRLLSTATVVSTPTPDPLAIIDPFAFIQIDDHHPNALPHTWSATSDAVAARVAVVFDANAVVLLKSATPPDDADWHWAAENGFVDSLFMETLQRADRLITAHAVNLRTGRAWSPTDV